MATKKEQTPAEKKIEQKQKKMTASAKEAWFYAFDAIGGKKRLAIWARANQDEFFRHFARLIPVDKTVQGASQATFVEDLKE